MRHKRFFLLNPTTSVQGNLTRFKTGAIKTSLKSIIVLATFALYLLPAFGQSPEKMSYQAVIRNSSDVLVTDTQVGMQISIIQGTADGSPVYTETQTPTTNANGLVSIEIGAGTVVSGIQWYNGSYIDTEAHGDGNYAGEMNTMLIIANQGSNSNSYAAGVCANYSVSGIDVIYGDWYLPSLAELRWLFSRKAIIDAAAEANGGSAFANAYYWSSTEYNNNYAWYKSFTSVSYNPNYKNNTYRVRAIRAF